MKYNEILKEGNKVLNYEGAEAFFMTPEMELYTAAVTSSLSGKFYEQPEEFVDRIAGLVGKSDAMFVAQLAVYTRTVMNLRSIPLLLLVELARVHNGDGLVSRAVAKTVLRADEICELLMCYQWRNPVPKEQIKKLGRLSRQIQNGLKESFNRFDEYQFAKYDRDSQVRLRDALFLVHPKAKSTEQQALFDKIVNGILETPYTWETRLSDFGQKKYETPELKADALKALWEELLDSGKLGYMALLRNIRNILNAGVSPQHIERMCERISDPEQVRKSKQLPFRFLSAYREVSVISSTYTGIVLEALEKAVLSTVDNIPGFSIGTNVLLASDISGSMLTPVSDRSSVQNMDIGILLSSMLRTKCKSLVAGVFGDVWKTVEPCIGPILANTVSMRKHEGEVGYSTNGYKVIDWLVMNNIRMDKVFFFTDCQMWDSAIHGYCRMSGSITKSWHRYKEICPAAKLYIFDLSGYGQAPLDIAEDGVYLIAGWNEKVFDVMEAVDNGADALDMIRNTEI